MLYGSPQPMQYAFLIAILFSIESVGQVTNS
jgi:hypothetical protein